MLIIQNVSISFLLTVFCITIDPDKIMSGTSLTLMQTVKPISAQNRYKPIWHNPQTLAVRALRDTWTRWLLRVCSQLRNRFAHNHSFRRHSVITFLTVNVVKSPLAPTHYLSVSPQTKRDAFCIGLQFMAHTHTHTHTHTSPVNMK